MGYAAARLSEVRAMRSRSSGVISFPPAAPSAKAAASASISTMAATAFGADRYLGTWKKFCSFLLLTL